jgi:hypothetical protein
MTRGIRLTGFLALGLLAALIVFLSADDASATPPPFDPGGVVCLDNWESAAECDGDMSPGASADIASVFCVAWNADCSARDATVNSSNTGGLVGFLPTDYTVPKGDTIPVGALAGRLGSEAWLGLLNDACRTRINVEFTLMNASINTSDTIDPRPEGATDVMQPLAMDKEPLNGIPDGADKYPSFLAEFFEINGTPIQPRARLFGISNIQKSWVTLNFLFFEPGQTLEIGQTVVTFTQSLGYSSVTILQDPTAQAAPSAITDFCAPLLTDVVTLGKTIDNPCTPTAVEGANCPVTADEGPDIEELGYPSFPCANRSAFDDDGDGKINDGCPQVNAVSESGADCENNTSDDGEDSAVNDGCPPFGDVSEGTRIPGDCSGGDEGGCTNRQNPAAAGTYTSTILAMTQRDADGDGWENGFDTCVYDYNPGWNPRGPDQVNDPDADGIPNECDPDKATAAPSSPNGCKSGYTGADQDQDCFANRADNCPLVASLKDPTKPPDNNPATNTNPPLAPDDDLDGIGNACDKNLNAVDGDNTGVCLKFPIAIGGAGGKVVGTADAQKGPDCAARIDETPVVATATLNPSVTPRPTGGSGSGGGGGGVNGGGDPGVGSLAPTAANFPVWAAVLAAIGAMGIIGGLTLYARLSPKRQR